jgi:hypothetical protein
MKDSKGRYRTYVEIVCPACLDKRIIRSDGIKFTMCKKCANYKKWDNKIYREKCSNAHKGKKNSDEARKKISLALKGKIPKNLKLMQDLHRLPNGIASARHAYSAKKKASKKRNHEFLLTFEEYYEIVTKKCVYCGAEPSQVTKPHATINGEFLHNGIDRIDNNKEYTKENSCSCCRRCNTYKRFDTVISFKKRRPDIFTEPLF